MKQKGKRTLTPRLRFPEFRDSEGWQTPQLSDLYAFKRTNTLSRDKLNDESGTIKNIHYGDIHTKFTSLFRVDREYVPFINAEIAIDAFQEEDDCEEGDIVFADASEDLRDIGKAIEVVSLDGQRVVAGTHTILATRHGDMPIIGFGGHLFQSAPVRAEIQRESQGAKVYGISAKRISPVTLPLPPTSQEQQKIAECLGSLEGLIAAEGRKLTALRDHKRGLIQQLFPQPGQTQPRLRFPEFRGKGVWEEERLDDLVNLQDGFPFKSTDFVEAQDGTTQVIRITDINNKNTNEDRVYIPTVYLVRNKLSKYSVNGEDLLLSLTGAAGFNFFFWNGGPATINQRTAKVIAKKKPGRALLRLLAPLIHEKINERGEGQNNNLSKKFLSTIVLPVPGPAEQQRIADCLTALDAQITSQAAKIDALKQHKRGLMQQLFPAPEELEIW